MVVSSGIIEPKNRKLDQKPLRMCGMEKIIVLLALVACLPGIGQAEWVNVFGSGDTRSITTIHDNGDVTSSSAY